jgi:hypothetical protein
MVGLRTATALVLSASAIVACSSHAKPPPAVVSQTGSTATYKARDHAFQAAASALSKQIHVSRDSIAGVSQEEVTWNDSCLGCPKTGEKCTQVLTPGYRIVLRVSAATYEYHTELGGRARLCGQALMPTPGPEAPVAPPPVPTPAH